MATCKDCKFHSVEPNSEVLCHNPEAIALFKAIDNWSKEDEKVQAIICDMWDVEDPCEFADPKQKGEEIK